MIIEEQILSDYKMFTQTCSTIMGEKKTNFGKNFIKVVKGDVILKLNIFL